MGKITYETHFKSQRPDGRHTTSFASYLERMRQTPQKLALPKNISSEEFYKWKATVIEKYKELLGMPEFTHQPDPQKLSEVQRDGYRVEKWEYYPDDYTAVPFLMLIPNGVTKVNTAPAVVCVPGAGTSKEFISGEPLIELPNCKRQKRPETNLMAQYYVKQGYVAIAVDNTAMCEVGLPVSDEDHNDFNFYSAYDLIMGYICGGTTYEGMQTFNLVNLVKKLSTFEFIDLNNIAVSAHSLGTVPVLATALFCDEIKAVVFNDYLGNVKNSFMCITEFEENARSYGERSFYAVPGMFNYFDTPDLCAALAPKYLTLNEGGADVHFDTVRRGYKAAGAENNVQLLHYPKFQNPESRKYHGEIPKYGLTQDEYFQWNYVDVPDHAFKKEPSLEFLKKVLSNQDHKSM